MSKKLQIKIPATALPNLTQDLHFPISSTYKLNERMSEAETTYPLSVAADEAIRTALA